MQKIKLKTVRIVHSIAFNARGWKDEKENIIKTMKTSNVFLKVERTGVFCLIFKINRSLNEER